MKEVNYWAGGWGGGAVIGAEGQCPPGAAEPRGACLQAGPAFRFLMSRLAAPLVGFREILCFWRWGREGEGAPRACSGLCQFCTTSREEQELGLIL